MIERDEAIKKLILAGLSFEHAATAFDLLKGEPEVDECRKAINRRYYEKNQEKRKAEEKAKRELRRLKKPVKTPIKMLKTSESTRYLAKIGTPQHEAWNAYEHDTKGKSLPYSDKNNGWWVPSEWPPTMMRAAR